jgi:ribosomal protein S27AE
MSVLLLEPPPVEAAADPMSAHGRFTLDELLMGVWEDLAVRAIVHCPVCGGRMAAHENEGARDAPVRHGVCGDCGSRLS